LLHTVLTATRIVFKVGLAILCLFVFPAFAAWVQTTNNLELTRSIAVYSLGAIAISLIIMLFRSLDKDTAELLNHKPAQE
jgi:Na+/melibiose symporter-like transporter